MSTTDGGPAYPYVVVTNVDPATGSPIRQEVQTGMSIRDYFAGQAMLIMANPKIAALGPPLDGTPSDEWMARGAYALADAMLAERSKEKVG